MAQENFLRSTVRVQHSVIKKIISKSNLRKQNTEELDIICAWVFDHTDCALNMSRFMSKALIMGTWDNWVKTDFKLEKQQNNNRRIKSRSWHMGCRWRETNCTILQVSFIQLQPTSWYDREAHPLSYSFSHSPPHSPDVNGRYFSETYRRRTDLFTFHFSPHHDLAYTTRGK